MAYIGDFLPRLRLERDVLPVHKHIEIVGIQFIQERLRGFCGGHAHSSTPNISPGIGGGLTFADIRMCCVNSRAMRFSRSVISRPL